MNQSQAKTCEVHLWKYCLLDPVSKISMDWFSVAEKEAIAMRGSYAQRMQFIRVHAFLKKVLERYTHQPADQIHLMNGLNGKPTVICDHFHPPFFFNLSYRHDYALLAISNESRVGVDVEKVEEMEDFFPFLTDHFSQNEQKMILTEDSELRQLSLLYTLWAMKEAVVKSLAIGLPRKLSKYDLSTFLDQPMGIQQFDPTHFWRIETIPLAENYRAAVAVRAAEANVKIVDYASAT